MTTPAPADPVPPTSGRHSLLEDLLALLTAAAFVSLGSRLLAHAGLLTGGTFGVALLLTRFTPLTFGQLYTLINLPFFWLGVRQMGWRFTLKTFATIVLVSLATDRLGLVLRIDWIHPLYASV
ncbi:MAG TPA: YitT family protein, partial [Anaeromyxobacteraceae bacterium]|nr:YitT family protein [Anaeromyxobacteraceae bacterium]